MIYDTIILGGGPAGCSAAVYASRKQLKTLLITESFGGQSVVSNDIDNWIGEKHISGAELAMKFEAHVKDQKDLDIKESASVTKITITQTSPYPIFEVSTSTNETFSTKSLIVTLGGIRRKLNIPGEKEFTGRGVAYCATCDAPFFKDKKVAVVGGGNSGLESVLDLIPYAAEIYIFDRNDTIKGNPDTLAKIQANPKLKNIFLKTVLVEVHGDQMVNSLTYENLDTKTQADLPIDGIFIEIGYIPNTALFKDLLTLNNWGEIVINHKNGETSQAGIFAAGDATDSTYKQNNIASGDAVKATLATYDYVQNLKD
jgi:alkyl hydroperoxide reductase subunit F